MIIKTRRGLVMTPPCIMWRTQIISQAIVSPYWRMINSHNSAIIFVFAMRGL